MNFIKTNQLLIGLASSILFFSFLASLILTSFGYVEVKSLRLDTDKGQYIVYDLFRPKSAKSESKAPFIAIIPGFQRSKEALSNIAIELSRRGYVVALIDPYAQGLSSSSLSTRAATTQGYGMFALVEHVYDGAFNFVDIDKIGATGHSMGGNAAIRGADFFGKQAIQNNTKSKLDSVYVSGYVLTLRNNILRDSKSNMGVSYALYDEGAFRNELTAWDSANMIIAPESLRTVNSVLPKEEQIKEVELGKYYGSKEKNSLRVIFNEPVLHPFQPYNFEATSNQLDYFEKVFGAPNPINSNNQIWHWKEIFTLINMVLALIMLIPIARLFLDLRFFSSIKKDIPAPLNVPNGKGKIIFWSIFFISALIACTTFIPMVEVAKILFEDAANRKLTWFFPQRMNNSVMLWAAFNGLVGIIIFSLSYKLFGKRNGVDTKSWGLDINRMDLLKTCILALVIFATFYSFLFINYALFHVDYRFWFMGVRIFQPEMLAVLLMYLPLFLIFFFSNSLRVNGAMRFKDQPEWLSMLIAGFANSAGLMLIIIIQYSVYFNTGTVFWTTNWLSVNLLFGIVPMMFILPYFNRIFFRMTGRVYLGPLVTCLVFIMILSTNTVVYLPIK
ncbi:MAG: hypothetical protein CM15mP11_01140 [Gammaproteobacteria bacterium]|nr:MAG: hypothetical protein CM15mP11_01140 [Gammaproteobacteria bacterium]